MEESQRLQGIEQENQAQDDPDNLVRLTLDKHPADVPDQVQNKCNY